MRYYRAHIKKQAEEGIDIIDATGKTDETGR
jgi:hypothetical protein